jgi:hypothetical protein
VRGILDNSFKTDNTAILQSIILPLVWYDRETWSLTLKEKLRRIQGEMRKIFGSHNEEQRFLYCVNRIILERLRKYQLLFFIYL